jgi:hypothetical protein
VAAEILATSHSEELGLPEESAFSWVWRRKADPSLRSGRQKKHFFRSLFSGAVKNAVEMRLLRLASSSRVAA